MVNLPMTSVMEPRGHRMAIAACFAFQRETNSSVLRDFFDSIDPRRTSLCWRAVLFSEFHLLGELIVLRETRTGGWHAISSH
jgi:hypothetical protein